MTLSKTMEDAISEKDLGKIYSSFYTILLSDPGFSNGKFDQAFVEVKNRNIEGFIQPYNGKPFKNSEDWDQQYWDSVASELMDNFCVERINHLKEVGKKLYSSNIPKQSLENTNNQDRTQKKTKTIQTLEHQKKINIGKLIAIISIAIIILIIIIVLIL